MTATEPSEAVGDPPRKGRTALISATAVGVVLVVLIAVLATSDPGGREVRSPLIGRQAPTLAGDSLIGTGSFDVADSQGQFTLVNFFATWCVPCIEEHPELVRFADTHARTGEARVVTVVLQDKPEDVARFFEREGGDWPVLADPQARFASEWGVAAPPESYLVAPDGTVLTKVQGGVTAAYLDGLLDQAMGRAES
jgi:cytochrome c biogenesis protein CcmG, thiol:disulfide interchange protein DsbE